LSYKGKHSYFLLGKERYGKENFQTY